MREITLSVPAPVAGQVQQVVGLARDYAWERFRESHGAEEAAEDLARWEPLREQCADVRSDGALELTADPVLLGQIGIDAMAGFAEALRASVEQRDRPDATRLRDFAEGLTSLVEFVEEADAAVGSEVDRLIEEVG